MIGGNDIVVPASGQPAALDACARIVHRHWPRVRFENAETAEKYSQINGIPFNQIRQLLAYLDAEAEAKWDADSVDSPIKRMSMPLFRQPS